MSRFRLARFDPSAGRDIRTSSDQDGFVTKFNADGSYAWTAVLGGRGWNNVTGLPTTPTGAVVVTGAKSPTSRASPFDSRLCRSVPGRGFNR